MPVFMISRANFDRRALGLPSLSNTGMSNLRPTSSLDAAHLRSGELVKGKMKACAEVKTFFFFLVFTWKFGAGAEVKTFFFQSSTRNRFGWSAGGPAKSARSAKRPVREKGWTSLALYNKQRLEIYSCSLDKAVKA